MENKQLLELIKRKENLLTLEHDWDDNGGEKISLEAWNGTVKFLTEYSESVFKNISNHIDLPNIYPSSNGSIDIQWETEIYGFIVNIDKSGTNATFFVDHKRNGGFNGSFNPHNFYWAILPTAITLSPTTKTT